MKIFTCQCSEPDCRNDFAVDYIVKSLAENEVRRNGWGKRGGNWYCPLHNQQSTSKHHNVKTTVDGIEFASGMESRRYLELKLLQEQGYISDLKLQVVFELQPKFRWNGVTQKAITYKADFTYISEGAYIVEDCKGQRTEVYKIKRKLLLYRYPQITFRESKA